MKARMIAYRKQDSPIHRLTGAAKLIFFALWSLAAMLTYDTRLLIGMLVLSLIALWISRVRFSDYSFVLSLILLFFLLNHAAVFAFSPLEGVKIYGTRHDLFTIAGRYVVTQEQLFYQLNILLKYIAVVPVALLFLLTTDPGEFAASLNRIGVNYKIAYSVSIAMRYIPDIQRDYQTIALSAQARGIDISRKEKLGKRIRNLLSILIPLLVSSMDRIESISAAMELRGFGRKPKRTWYNARPFSAADYAAVALAAVMLAASVFLMIQGGTRFYNVFRLG